MRIDRRTMLAGLAGVGGCTPLDAFNTLSRVDKGGALVVSGAAYGPDPRQAIDVYRPDLAPSAPVLVYFYGGSWNSGSRQQYAFVGKTFAARGYVTVIADYRLMPQHPFPAFVEDGAAAIRFARARAGDWGGASGKIYVAGHSAGAYIAAMLAVSNRYGVQGDIAAFAGIAGPYDFYPFTNRVTQATFGGWPRPQDTQPVATAAARAPPTLLVHGADDRVVPPRSSIALGQRLAQAGVAAQVKLYPGVGHIDILTALTPAFRKRAPTLSDITTFFAEHGARARASLGDHGAAA